MEQKDKVTNETTANTQKGGGASGYDVEREKQQVEQEREDMNNERDTDQLNVEENQQETPKP